MKWIKVYLKLIILILLSVFIYLNYNCKYEKSKIAVLDTGVEKKAIKSKVISRNFTLDNNSNSVHANKVSKIIEYEADIVIYDAKVLNHHGNGRLEDTISALDWAIKNNVDIINMSYGFTKNYPELHRKIKEAHEKGIIIVAANGNDIFGGKEFPASYKETISVGVLNKEGSKSVFNSNDDADVFISVDNKLPNSGENNSMATAYVSNKLTKLCNRNLRNMDKDEILKLINELN
ncbi:S8 family serine peptidase [Staphylococcus pseudintermedius]|nr:S8 family serine peptidase [Staphylococcus pseudintermedius]